MISLLLGKPFDVSTDIVFSAMLVGSKNTLIYNLDVSLISDFIDSLMTVGTAETGGPIW